MLPKVYLYGKTNSYRRGFETLMGQTRRFLTLTLSGVELLRLAFT